MNNYPQKSNLFISLGVDVQKFALAVQYASDHIVITDPEGIILYANPAVEKITGFLPIEILGKKAGAKELWGGLMGKDFYEKLWEAIKIKKIPFSGEINNRRKGGTSYTALSSISPVLDEKGEVIYFVGIERDITREKEVDRMKTEFIYLASHQLRSPLTAIKWFVEMLTTSEMGGLSEDQKKYIDKINKANEKMITLVNSLLNISRLETGKLVLEPTVINLEAALEELLAELQPDITSKNLKVNFHHQGDLTNIMLDAKLIPEVYKNLLTNAIKYTPVDGSVTLDVEKTETELINKVSDNGCGIPLDVQNRIFQKFFRAENAQVIDAKGSGLGLYLVKSIVELAGGKITFASPDPKTGKGTVFSFNLPINK